ncbi:MAG TPA: APC family permease [Burkholderiaceae bacterium]|nr:APC family permease [Burkholderiaceae bacterium]
MTRSGAEAAPGVPLPVLSTFDAAMIVCGIVIGGSIFVLPSLVASTAGSVDWMFAAWVLGAVLTLVGSLCYAELASTFPHAGGDYHFLTRAFGRDVSFFFGWARVVVTTTGPTAMHAYIFGGYASRILPLGAASSAVYAALVVVLLTALNVVGLKESSRTQNLITLVLVAGMVLVALGGFLTPAESSPAAAAQPATPPLLGLALVFVLYTYGGWNEAAYISAELRGGRRAILTALLCAIAVITALYLVFVAALDVGLGFEGLKASDAPAADVARRAFGPFGQTLIATVVCLSVLASSNATMIVGARSNYALALDWPILSFMSRWDRKRDVPVAAFVVQGAITLGLVVFAAYEQNQVRTIVEFTAPVFWFFFLLSGVSLFVLRKKYAHVARPCPVPLYPLLPLIFVGTCGFLLWNSLKYAQSHHALQVAFGVMAVGFVLWLIARLKGK